MRKHEIQKYKIRNSMEKPTVVLAAMKEKLMLIKSDSTSKL